MKPFRKKITKDSDCNLGKTRRRFIFVTVLTVRSCSIVKGTRKTMLWVEKAEVTPDHSATCLQSLKPALPQVNLILTVSSTQIQTKLNG